VAPVALAVEVVAAMALPVALVAVVEVAAVSPSFTAIP
jgi:hypothetical protein